MQIRFALIRRWSFVGLGGNSVFVSSSPVNIEGAWFGGVLSELTLHIS